MDRGQQGGRATLGAAVAAWGIDAAAVVLFVAIGRGSHHHAETVSGFLSTAWPFAVGLVAGWALVAGTGRRLPSPWSGAIVCVVTVAAGMVLRVLAGQGTAAAFVGVSLGFLGAIMVAGRVVLGVVQHRAGPMKAPDR